MRRINGKSGTSIGYHHRFPARNNHGWPTCTALARVGLALLLLVAVTASEDSSGGPIRVEDEAPLPRWLSRRELERVPADVRRTSSKKQWQKLQRELRFPANAASIASEAPSDTALPISSSPSSAPVQSLTPSYVPSLSPVPSQSTSPTISEAPTIGSSDFPSLLPSVQPASSSPSAGPKVRFPAEYEPSKAILISWSYFPLFRNLLVSVAQAVAVEGVEVWLVGGEPDLAGVPEELYMSLDLPVNSVWIRDYGPLGIHESATTSSREELVMIDAVYPLGVWRPDDDSIPCQVAREKGIECQPNDLILDGGNIMTDGNGNLFMTSITYEWNDGMTRDEVNDALKEMFGVTKVHAIDYAVDSSGFPADGTGHIDMFVKILTRNTVIISETSDPIFKPAMDSAADFFSTLRCGRGRCFSVSRVPGWTAPSSFGAIWYSYTNSLIVGNSILVPGYSNGNDEEVKAIYEAAAPGKNITMINSDGVIDYGGSIHCLTMQVPVDP